MCKNVQDGGRWGKGDSCGANSDAPLLLINHLLALPHQYDKLCKIACIRIHRAGVALGSGSVTCMEVKPCQLKESCKHENRARRRGGEGCRSRILCLRNYEKFGSKFLRNTTRE
jgi:hypothetical protein